MSAALVFDGVRKSFGKAVALDGLDFSVPEGSLCGLVGPNGAGKTTAFSIVSGTLRLDSGRVEVLGAEGFDVWRLKGRLGVLPQDAELGLHHTPTELLHHLAQLQGLGRRGATDETARVLELVGLSDRRRRRIGTLSHGMRRRVAVATAMLGSPELMLLDEPTAGLDPVQARELRTTLQDRRPGQTVVVSSHNLDELERMCDHIVMMDKGRCVRQGPTDRVTGREERVSWVLGPGEVPLQALRAAVPAHRFELEGRVLQESAPSGGDLDASSLMVAATLAKAGVPLREVRRGLSLERRFLADAAT